ncbi:MAG: hypothetical protein K8I27_06745 [Planctomycetes bacterium]|nr:hypothetical protein [Planctomycetota bacterium]
MNEEDLKADLDANLIAEAGFCWHLYPNRPAYELSDFIRDLELFVGGPVQDDQVLITWKRVLGTTDKLHDHQLQVRPIWRNIVPFSVK